MRIVVILLIFLALFAAGGTAFLAKRFLDEQKNSQTELKAKITTEKTLVIVAAPNLPAGAVLKSSSLEWQAWPKEGVADTYISAEKKDPKLTKQFIGMVLRRSVAAGTPLTKKMVFKRDKAGFLAGALKNGMRAVAVAVTPTSGASGFILPGDFVDIILSFKLPSSNNFSVEEKKALKSVVLEKTAETIVTNVRVLAIGQKFNKIETEAEVVKTITLEVTTKQSETLALAASMGKISLVLRSLTQEGTVEKSGTFTSDLQISQTLRGIFSKAKKQTKLKADRAAETTAETEARLKAEAAARATAKLKTKPRLKKRVRSRRRKQTVRIYRGTTATTQEIQR